MYAEIGKVTLVNYKQIYIYIIITIDQNALVAQ